MNACGARGVWTSAPFLALGHGNRGTSLAGSGPGMPVHLRCPRLASPQKEGEFTLHGRAILEMEQYIRETYPDAVKVCNICRGLLIQVPGARQGALSRTHSGPRPLTCPEPPRCEQTMGVSSEASDDKCMGACLSPLVLLFCPRLFPLPPPERLSEVFCGAHVILAAARHTSFLSQPHIPVGCLPLRTLYGFRAEQLDQCWMILFLSFCLRFFFFFNVNRF